MDPRVGFFAPPISHNASNFSTESPTTDANSKPRVTGEGSDSADAGKSVKPAPQRKDNSSVAASEMKTSDSQTDKGRKKDVPNPRLQFGDENRFNKAKKRSVAKQAEARNIVELFRHLPQYEHGARLTHLESNFFRLCPIHPAVYKVGFQYLSADVSGGNAQCIAMLQAFQESFKDYSTPPETNLFRDLTSKLNCYVSFLIECRPLSISMSNAIRFLKRRIASLPLNISDSEAITSLLSEIGRFINDKIILADKVIAKHAVSKIRDGKAFHNFSHNVCRLQGVK